MKMIKMLYHLFVDNRLSTLSGALCFFILINGGSYFFLFVSISGYLPINVKELLVNSTNILEFSSLVNYLFEYNKGISISVLLIITSIYSSSTLYYQFLSVVEVLTKRKQVYKLRKRIMALILVPIVLVLYIFLVYIIASLNSLLGKTYYLLITAASVFIAICVLNMLGLRTVNIRKLYKGVLGSFCFVILFTYLFIIYLNFSGGFKIVYGAFSFYIIILFYLYVSVMGILYGIAFNCQKIEE